MTQLLIAMVVLTPAVAGERFGSGTGRLLAVATDAHAAVPRGAQPHEVHAEVAEALRAGLEELEEA